MMRKLLEEVEVGDRVIVNDRCERVEHVNETTIIIGDLNREFRKSDGIELAHEYAKIQMVVK